MDPTKLAEAVVFIFGFFLPHLLGGGEQAAREASEKYGEQGWGVARSVWALLRPKIEAGPTLLKAAQDMAQHPDEDTMAALQQHLEVLFGEEPALAQELYNLIALSSYVSLLDLTPHEAFHWRAERDLVTLDKMIRERKRYAWCFFSLTCAGYAASIISRQELMWPAYVFALGLIAGRVIMAIVYAQKVGMKWAGWFGVASLFGPWLTWLAILSFRPPHLTRQALEGRGIPEKGEMDRAVRWGALVLAAIPFLLFILLLVGNPEYILGQFHVPLGWILFTAMLILSVLRVVPLLFVWNGKACEGGEIAAVAIVAGLLFLPTVWLILLGPAAVKLFELYG